MLLTLHRSNSGRILIAVAVYMTALGCAAALLEGAAAAAVLSVGALGAVVWMIVAMSLALEEHRGRALHVVIGAVMFSTAVASLTACEGPAGPSGAPGISGKNGTNGVAGPTGENGQPGGQGPQGPTGPTGPGAEIPYWTADGLEIEILSAEIDETGAASVEFHVTDGDDLPLDIDRLLTQGEVSARFVLAWLSKDEAGRPGKYTAYTTRTQTSTGGRTEQQASSDTNGTFTRTAPGTYAYRFAALADPTKRAETHLIGVYATREVGGTRQVDEDTFGFVPDGSAEPLTKQVATDAACNGCHGELTAHGGARRTIELCSLCHTEQTIDPDTGNSADLKVMVHKIHRGESLPSVEAGRPYRLIGNRESVHDYSTVVFPQEINNCSRCHDGADGDLWARRPNMDACGSCHDDISFSEPVPVGKRLHRGGVQRDHALCTVCHPRTGSLAGLEESHRPSLADALLREPQLELISVTDVSPGQAPSVTFRVSVDGQARDISAAPLNSLRALIVGPNTDYKRYWQVTIQGSGATGTLTAVDAANGVFRYQLPQSAALPGDATGSWTLGLEGYLQESGGPRYAAMSRMIPFAVDGGPALARRVVVENERCESCHERLAGHGGGRRGAQYCTTCHISTNANDDRSARFEGRSIFVQTVDLKAMIHRIHYGESLTKPYVLGGNPSPSRSNPAGTPINFGHVRYPNAKNNCTACHAPGTADLPLDPELSPSVLQVRTCLEDPARDTDSYCDNPFWTISSTITLPAATAACTGCHDDDSTLAHAAVNTTSNGAEACSVCHGPGSEYDVARFHTME